MVNDEFERLEEQRKEALARQDAMKYSRLCDTLSVSPEDEILYNIGCERREYHRQVGKEIAKKIAVEQKKKEKTLEEIAHDLNARFKDGGTPYENTRDMRDCYEEVKTVEINGKKELVSKVDDAILAYYSIKLMDQYK